MSNTQTYIQYSMSVVRLDIDRLQHKLQSQMAHQEDKRLSRKHFPLQLLLIRETRHFIQLWRISAKQEIWANHKN